MSKKASQQRTADNLRMEMSPTAREMLIGILTETINAIRDKRINDGFEIGVVCSHLRCVMAVVHTEDWQFEAGLEGDAIRPAINKMLQQSVESLDWKRMGGL